MSTVIRHFLPDVCTDIEQLRTVVSDLSTQESALELGPYNASELLSRQVDSTMEAHHDEGSQVYPDPILADMNMSEL